MSSREAESRVPLTPEEWDSLLTAQYARDWDFRLLLKRPEPPPVDEKTWNEWWAQNVSALPDPPLNNPNINILDFQENFPAILGGDLSYPKTLTAAFGHYSHMVDKWIDNWTEFMKQAIIRSFPDAHQKYLVGSLAGLKQYERIFFIDSCTELKTKNQISIKEFIRFCKTPFSKLQIYSTYFETDNERNSTIKLPGLGAHKLSLEFNVPFVDEGDVLKTFSDYVDHVAQAQYSEFEAPYFVVTQSSGFGKSRLACEYAKTNPCFYICTRKTGSTGFPLASKVASVLKPPLKYLRELSYYDSSILYVTFYTTFLAACLLHLKNTTSFDPKQWIDVQIGSGADIFWDRIIHIHANILGSCFDRKLKQSPDVYALRIINHVYAELSAESAKRKVMFIFDEASEYLAESDTGVSYLHYLCLAFRVLPEANGRRPVAVLLDTLVSISNFAPVLNEDPFVRSIAPMKLFPPFHILPHQLEPEDLALPLDEEAVKRLFQCTGRYLWQIYDDPRMAISVAKAKLVYESNYRDVENCNSTQALAILGIRASLHFKAPKQLAYELVHKHMATLFRYTTDRESVKIGYLSEPVLAAAAMDLQVCIAGFRWKNVLPTLVPLISCGLIDAGFRGELVTRILLLMAMDAVRMKSPNPYDFISTSQTIKIEVFLDSLLGPNSFETLCLPQLKGTGYVERLRSGMVNFTHFIPVEYTPTLSDLRRYFIHQGAIYCRRNEDLFDFMIPVYLSDETFTVILVQCCLHSKGSDLNHVDEDVLNELKDPDCPSTDLPFVYLYMELDNERSPRIKMCALQRDKHGNLQKQNPVSTPLVKSTSEIIMRPDTSQTEFITEQPNFPTVSTRQFRSEPESTLPRELKSPDVKSMNQPPKSNCAIIGLFSIRQPNYPFLSDTERNLLHRISRSFEDPILASKYKYNAPGFDYLDKYSQDMLSRMLCMNYSLSQNELNLELIADETESDSDDELSASVKQANKRQRT